MMLRPRSRMPATSAGGGRVEHDGQRGAWRARGARPQSVSTHPTPPPCPLPMPSASCRLPPRHPHCATSIASRPQIRPHTLRLCRLRRATLHCVVSATPPMSCRTHRSDRTPSGRATSTASYPHGWASVASTLRTMMPWPPRARRRVRCSASHYHANGVRADQSLEAGGDIGVDVVLDLKGP
jgi:hypothetical protein